MKSNTRTCPHGVAYDDPRDLLSDCSNCGELVRHAIPHMTKFAQNLCDRLNNTSRLPAINDRHRRFVEQARKGPMTLWSSIHSEISDSGNQSIDTMVPEHELLMQHLFAGRLARKITPSLDILDFIIDTKSESLFRAIEQSCRRTIRAVYGRDLIIQVRPFPK